MKFLNLGCPQKPYGTCKVIVVFYATAILHKTTGSVLFSNRKYKRREKTSSERKKLKKKRTASANINSRKALKI